MIRTSLLTFFVFVSPVFAALPYIPKFDSDGRYFVNTNMSAPIVIEGNMSRFDEETDTPVIVQFEDGDRPGWYWNGSDWTTTNIRYNSYHANPHPFWRHLRIERIEEVSTTNPTLPFQRYVTDRVSIRIEQSDFTEAFWMGRESFNLRVKLGHSPEGNDKYLEKTFPFKKTEVTRIILNNNKTYVQINLGDTATLHIDARFSNNAAMDPEKLYYQIHRINNENSVSFWENSEWSNSTSWTTLNPNSQTESQFTVTSNQSISRTAQLTTPHNYFINNFWNDQNAKYYLTIRYQDENTEIVSNNTLITYTTTQPEDISEISFEQDNPPKLRWRGPPNTDPTNIEVAYMVAVQNLNTGSWLTDPNWKSPEMWTKSTIYSLEHLNLEYNTTYRALVYAVFYTKTRNQESEADCANTNGICNLLPQEYSVSSGAPYVDFELAKPRLPDINAYTNLSLTPLEEYELTSPTPTFSIVPTNGTLPGKWYVGLRDEAGKWLDPLWRERPDLETYSPMNNGKTYDVFIQNEQYGRRTDIRKMGKVRYIQEEEIPDDRYENRNPPLSQNLTAEFSLSTPGQTLTEDNVFINLSYAFYFHDRHTTESYRQLSSFIGYSWADWRETSSKIFLSLREAKEYPAFKNSTLKMNEDGTYTLIVDFTGMSFEDRALLELTSENPTEIEIRYGANISDPNSPLMQTKYQPISINPDELVRANRQVYKQEYGLTLTFRSYLQHISYPQTEWLWKDSNSGKFWDGFQWIENDSVPPWTRVDHAKKTWPNIKIENYKSGYSASYPYKYFKEDFMDNLQSKDIKVFFRNSEIVSSFEYQSNSLKITEDSFILDLEINSHNWGEHHPRHRNSILLKESSASPSYENTSINLREQPNSFLYPQAKLFFQLKKKTTENNNTTYKNWSTSAPIPLSKTNKELTSREIHEAIRNLLFNENEIAFKNLPNDSEFLLVSYTTQSNDLLYPTLLPENWKIEISLNGIRLPILTDPNPDNITDQTGIPVIIKTTGQFKANSLYIENEGESNQRDYQFPYFLEGYTWASKGDTLKPRFSSTQEQPSFFNPQWTLMRLNPETIEWEIVEIRQSPSFTLNQNYNLKDRYRLIFLAEDEYGFPEKAVQDFGSIRDITNTVVTFNLQNGNVSSSKPTQIRAKLGTNQSFITSLDGGLNSDGFQLNTIKFEQDIYNQNGIMTPVDFPGLSLVFRKTYQNENNDTVYSGLSSTWDYSDQNWVGECYLNQTQSTTALPLTNPFPLVLYDFTIEDTWTNKTYYFDEGQIRIEHDGIIDCEPEEEFLAGTILPKNFNSTWMFQDDNLSNYVVNTRVKFDYSKFNLSPSRWYISLSILSQDGENTANASVNLETYLNATGQSLENLPRTLINHSQQIAEGDFFFSASSIISLSELKSRLNSSNILPNGSKEDLAARIVLSIRRPNDPDPLMTTTALRGDGYPFIFEHGIPAESTGLTHFEYDEVSIDRVLFRSDINQTVTFTQTLSPNMDIQPEMVDWQNFTWKWLHQGQAWNGQDWIPLDQTEGISIGHSGFLSNSYVSFDPENNKIVINAQISSRTLQNSFWQNGNPIPVQLVVTYKNPDDALITSNNQTELIKYTTHFTLYKPDSAFVTAPRNLNSGLGTRSDQAMAMLRRALDSAPSALNRALQLSYAPEPMLLDAEVVQETSNHLWVLGKNPLLTSEIETETPDLNALDCYTWLTVPFTPDPEQVRAKQHMVYLVPYPKNAADQLNFTYQNRQPVTLNDPTQIGWQQAGNVFWSTYLDLDEQRQQLYVIVFIPEEEIQRSPLAEVETETYQENYELTQFLNGGFPSFGETNTHNRLVEIAYPDPADPEHSVVTVQFADLTGRTQEVRTMASKAPADMLQKVVISGMAEYDSLGRQTKAGKNLLAAIGQNAYLGNPQLESSPYRVPPLELAAAGSRADTFAAGTRFWHQGNVRPGGVDLLSYILNKDSAPFEETLYEQDPTRARILASLPMGEKARDSNDPLRYTRYHYLTIRAQQNGANLPAELDLIIDNLETGNNLLPIARNGETPQPGLTGTLMIDPNGLMTLTLTGMEERTLFTITNPDISLLQSWGFQVHVGENATTLDNSHIYLPADYAARVGESGASDRNLVSFQEYDRKGRLVASWPPRALVLSRPGGGPWTIASTGGVNANLRTRYQYDAHDRLVTTIEADAGTSQFVYDRHGRVRLNQTGRDMGTHDWTETIYDRQGRVVRTLRRNLAGFSHGSSRQTLQAWLTPISGNTPPDFGELPLTNASSYAPWTETFYDQYDMFNERFFPANTGFGNGWPQFNELQEAYPWSPDGIRFADPIGQVVEICGMESGERFYYDAKGRIVCRVYMLAGVMEPQISWLKYDNRDLVTAYYNQTHHQGLGFQYDAFARLIRTYDLTPLSDRMLIGVSHRQVGQDFTTPLATTEVALGPLIDEAANISLDNEKRTLTQWSYTPTGHLGAIRFGDPAGAQIENSYRYDVRDWLYQQQVAVGEVPTYSVDLDYFGLNNCFDGDCGQNDPLHAGVQRMYDGSIAILSETYHLTTEAESRGSGSSTAIVPQVLRHEFGYDGVYQLTAAYHSWPQWYSQHYSYDRNGNRVREQQTDKPGVNGGGLTTNRLSHLISGVSNRLEYLNADGDGQNWDQAVFGYDNAGNVNHIEHYSITNGFTKIFDQSLAYGDYRFPQLPTAIEQRQTNPVPADSSELDENTRYYQYDHNGARISREVVNTSNESELTYFVPSGNDNAVELDRFGRAKRYYLFNGTERFGYKSKQNTGLYVKDYLGSTKMVIAANRDLPEADPSQIPPAANFGPVQGYQPLLKMDFEGDLNNQGLLSAGTAVTKARYVSRDGRRALWLDRGDMVTVADDARTENLTNQFSIMLWLYDEDERDGDDDHGTMVCVGTQRSIRYNPIHWYLDAAKQPILRVGGGAEGWQFLSQWPTVPHRTWVQLAVTYDGEMVRFYQNGEEVGQPQAITLPALYPAQQIALGDWPTYDGYRWHGALDQVEIHDRVMALEDVRAHYNQMLTLPVFNTSADTEVAAQPLAYNQIRSLMVQRLGDTDPFGNTLRESYNSGLAGDTKEPHQFTGQEREHGTGLTYMGGRWYMPAAGRFLQVDPRRELVNSYSYVANNPIIYVDPDGKKLYFHQNSSIDERQSLLGELQKLTDHKLSYDRNFRVFIKEKATKETLPHGNRLIMDLLETRFKNTIRINTDKENKANTWRIASAHDGTGAKAKININPDEKSRVYVKSATSDKSVKADSNIPLHIAIAHELIHAYRFNKGIAVEGKTNNVIQIEGQKAPKILRTDTEEMETIGLGDFQNKHVTENQLREEHSIPERRSH